MKMLRSSLNFVLGLYYGALSYWFVSHNFANWWGLCVLLTAGFALYITLAFVISSIVENERRAAVVSSLGFGVLTLALFAVGYSLVMNL